MMATRTKTKVIAEFGDFQTPVELARAVCELLVQKSVQPATIVEPTCGKGNFLVEAITSFPNAEEILGIDINDQYVHTAAEAVSRVSSEGAVRTMVGDFFATDWLDVFDKLPDPILVIGNPPWVTNTELGALQSKNLPQKSNFQRYSGMDAITGKSNFDISEWMLLHVLEWLDGRCATLAMLCKTNVARKVLAHAWKHNRSIERSEIHRIDAIKWFGAAVDACLLICVLTPNSRNRECRVFSRLGDAEATAVFGNRDGLLVADTSIYERWKHLLARDVEYQWRSGIKHDCTKVMEFRKEGDHYRNGLGELVELEDTYLYPMLKSSELANGRAKVPARWMLVTQQTVGEDTLKIRRIAPKTWQYLSAHADALDRRGSSIYRNRPRFSVFGVGKYSFAPAKVAISGFYKKLAFVEVASFCGKPIVLDDTANFLPCRTPSEAQFLVTLLNSHIAHEFFTAFVFWDSKRPVTIELLRRLNLRALARELGLDEQFPSGMENRLTTAGNRPADPSRQLSLFQQDS